MLNNNQAIFNHQVSGKTLLTQWALGEPQAQTSWAGGAIPLQRRLDCSFSTEHQHGRVMQMVKCAHCQLLVFQCIFIFWCLTRFEPK